MSDAKGAQLLFYKDQPLFSETLEICTQNMYNIVSAKNEAFV